MGGDETDLRVTSVSLWICGAEDKRFQEHVKFNSYRPEPFHTCSEQQSFAFPTVTEVMLRVGCGIQSELFKVPRPGESRELST